MQKVVRRLLCAALALGAASDVWVAVLMDLAWVLGSYVLMFIVPFSTEGSDCASVRGA